MQSNESVIVDTSVWVAYLRGRDPVVAAQLGALINQRQAVVCGIVLAEILTGVRNPQERAKVNDPFLGLPYVEMFPEAWFRAGDLAHLLRSQGFSTPLSDLILATIALEHGYAIFTHDTHFQRIPNLPLYQPA